MTRPWLSIITVVKDDDVGLRRTLKSIDSQELSDTELVVVDGSTDVSRVKLELSGRRQDTTYVWSPPEGIYPAMNIGVEIARGDFVYFANAGDTLFSSDVLESVRHQIAGAQWGFGHIEVVETYGARVISPPWDYAREKKRRFSGGYFPAHQGTFVSLDLMRQAGGFDTSFRIAADYALILKLSQIAEPRVLPFVIATFLEGGASTTRWSQAVVEFHRARREAFELHGLEHFGEVLATSRQWMYAFAQRVVRPRILRRMS